MFEALDSVASYLMFNISVGILYAVFYVNIQCWSRYGLQWSYIISVDHILINTEYYPIKQHHAVVTFHVPTQ